MKSENRWHRHISGSSNLTVDASSFPTVALRSGLSDSQINSLCHTPLIGTSALIGALPLHIPSRPQLILISGVTRQGLFSVVRTRISAVGGNPSFARLLEQVQ